MSRVRAPSLTPPNAQVRGAFTRTDEASQTLLIKIMGQHLARPPSRSNGPDWASALLDGLCRDATGATPAVAYASPVSSGPSGVSPLVPQAATTPPELQSEPVPERPQLRDRRQSDRDTSLSAAQMLGALHGVDPHANPNVAVLNTARSSWRRAGAPVTVAKTRELGGIQRHAIPPATRLVRGAPPPQGRLSHGRLSTESTAGRGLP